jgi:hypothetical protein
MAKTSAADELLKILETGSTKACLKFFERASEEERKAVAPTAVAFMKKAAKVIFIENPPGTFNRNEAWPRAQVALLAAGSLSEIKAAKWRGIPDTKDAFEVLNARRPKWTTEYAQWLTEQGREWALVRHLVRSGLCEPPTHDNYILCMIPIVSGGRWREDPFLGGKKGVAEYLRLDPGLRDNEIWRLFEMEGAGELTLAATDHYVSRASDPTSWSHGLVELSRSGEVSRERLLDASLAALNRGFSQFRVAWFAHFHTLLKPTIKERLARQQSYLDLLASPIPPTVTFALDAIDTIDAEKPLAADGVLAAIPPVMLAKHKGTAKRGLAWLTRLAEREAKCRPVAGRIAAQGLAHEAADVQKGAIDFLQKYGDAADKETRAQVTQFKAGVAASLRARVDQWLGGNPAAETPAQKSAKKTTPTKRAANGNSLEQLLKEAATLDKQWRKSAGIDVITKAWQQGEVDLTAAEFDVFEIPQLSAETRVTPIADLDELLDVCSQFVEDPHNIEQGERALDGLSRLCDQRPADFERRTGPLFKRVQKLTGRGGWKALLEGGLHDDMLDLILTWASGKLPKFTHKLRSRQQRSYEVAQRIVSRTPRPLLSAPTHASGWVDPLVIAERLKAWSATKGMPSDFDAAFALLRLAPDGRANALKQLSKFDGEIAAAFRHALGDDKVKIGSSEVLWACATRARHPYRDDPAVLKHFSDLGPNGAVAAKFSTAWKVRKWSHFGESGEAVEFKLAVEPPVKKNASGNPALELISESRFDRGEPESHVRWLAYMWPAGRESLFARGCAVLADNLDWWEASWENKKFLEPLLDPNCPIGEMGTLLLSLGLVAKEPGEHGLATDILVAAIEQGRMDAARLSPPLVQILQQAKGKPARLAKVLGVVGQTSPLHLFAVRELLENMLAATLAEKDTPKELPQLLELLLEFLSEAGESVSSVPLQSLLKQQTGSGKLPKAAKAILALPTQTNGELRRQVVERALQGRIAQAKRWSETT